jgi:Dickkopf-like protein
MSRSMLQLTLALLTSGCLLLQDPPVHKVGGECDGKDWCEDGLLCVRPNGPNNPGVCNQPGDCYVDENCPAGALCQGTTTFQSLGVCTANKGCTSDAQCASGLSCFRGGCWKKCSSTLECGTSAICTRVPCPANMSLLSCPEACQAF